MDQAPHGLPFGSSFKTRPPGNFCCNCGARIGNLTSGNVDAVEVSRDGKSFQFLGWSHLPGKCQNNDEMNEFWEE